MKFPESTLAHELLDGLQGIEIGGAAHNPFGLNTWNIDRFGHFHPMYVQYSEGQRDLCGEVMPIDVVAHGDQLPFADDSLDFVISSHVIEHFYDPIAALEEWARVAKKFIFIICPQPDALAEDVDLPLTTLAEHQARHDEPATARRSDDRHHSRWTSANFVTMCDELGHCVIATEDPDTKVGNGFTIVIDVVDDQATTTTGILNCLRNLVRRSSLPRG